MLATMLQIEPIFNRTIVLRVSLTQWWIKTPSSPPYHSSSWPEITFRDSHGQYHQLRDCFSTEGDMRDDLPLYYTQLWVI